MNGVWTNNWRGLKNAMLLGNIMPGMDTLVTTSGGTIQESPPSLYLSSTSPFAAYSNGSSGYFNYIRVGTSTTTPAVTDIGLAAPASNISYLSIANEAITYDIPNGTATKTVKLIIQNVGSSSVTLNEWGVFTPIYRQTSASDYFLVYRELFDSSITLQPYESATLTLTLTITLNDPL